MVCRSPFYFEDPEGHMIEVYSPTGVACRPRHGEPIDLTRSEEALRRDVPELAARAGAPPSENELAIARFQGEHVARIAQGLAA
jgi:catechol-2,3-dioxygenase